MSKWEYWTQEEVNKIMLDILQGKDYPKEINYDNCESFEQKQGKFYELIHIVRKSDGIEQKIINAIKQGLIQDALSSKPNIEEEVKTKTEVMKEQFIKENFQNNT